MTLSEFEGHLPFEAIVRSVYSVMIGCDAVSRSPSALADILVL